MTRPRNVSPQNTDVCLSTTPPPGHNTNNIYIYTEKLNANKLCDTDDVKIVNYTSYLCVGNGRRGCGN